MTSAEDVSHNILRVIGDGSIGTGFFIQKELCVTCHHVISKMNAIKVEYKGKSYDAEWVPEYSDMDKDIAILRVKNCEANPLSCARGALPGLEVSGFGFESKLLEWLPEGTPFDGRLGTTVSHYTEKAQEIKQDKPWKKKPVVSVEVYKMDCDITGQGLSGSPVCQTASWQVVGMFAALSERQPPVGFVIPIENILDTLKKEIPTAIQPASHGKSSYELITEANTLVDEKQVEKAIEVYEMVANDPNYLYAWYNKGVVLGNLGRSQEAIECYDKAIQIDPNYADAWYNKGVILGSLARNLEAIECYDKTIQINPSDANAWYNKGVALGSLGKNPEAIECYDKTTQIDTNYYLAWYNKGVTQENLGRSKEAIECYDKTIQINPNYADAWYNKGLILGRLGRGDEEIACYDKTIQIDPNYADAWNNKGAALGKLGREDEEIACYDKTIQINPNYFVALYNKARVYAKRKENENALESLAKAISINKDSIQWAQSDESFSGLRNEKKFMSLMT
jgi:tetratricopeptide (TPR) repeat protein